MSSQILVSKYHRPLKGTRASWTDSRAGEEKVQGKPRTSSCMPESKETLKKQKGTCLKDIKANLKGLPLAKSGGN